MLGLFNLTTAGAHGLSNITANSARISLGALAPDRKLFQMASASITLDVFKALDVAGNEAFEVALGLQGLDDRSYLIFSNSPEFFRSGRWINTGLFQNGKGARTANTINSREAEFNSFVIGNSNTCDTHTEISLSLPLLMLGILANNMQPPFTADQHAMSADFFDGGFDFHVATVV